MIFRKAKTVPTILATNMDAVRQILRDVISLHSTIQATTADFPIVTRITSSFVLFDRMAANAAADAVAKIFFQEALDKAPPLKERNRQQWNIPITVDQRCKNAARISDIQKPIYAQPVLDDHTANGDDLFILRGFSPSEASDDNVPFHLFYDSQWVQYELDDAKMFRSRLFFPKTLYWQLLMLYGLKNYEIPPAVPDYVVSACKGLSALSSKLQQSGQSVKLDFSEPSADVIANAIATEVCTKGNGMRLQVKSAQQLIQMVNNELFLNHSEAVRSLSNRKPYGTLQDEFLIDAEWNIPGCVGNQAAVMSSFSPALFSNILTEWNTIDDIATPTISSLRTENGQSVKTHDCDLFMHTATSLAIHIATLDRDQIDECTRNVRNMIDEYDFFYRFTQSVIKTFGASFLFTTV